MRVTATAAVHILPLNRQQRIEEMANESSPIHLPVMVTEVLEHLTKGSGGSFIDATVGAGGHARAILQAVGPQGQLLGIDRDAEILDLAAERLAEFAGRCRLVHAEFSDVREVAHQSGIENCTGILADLGVSSLQLDSAERGFSFQKDGPLDMRMDRELALTASEIVNHWPEKDLANLIFNYGEERHSRRIAKAIVKARPLKRTTDLAAAIARSIPSRGSQRLHPATRTFQALRIFVNDELARIPKFIYSSIDLLKQGGRIAIISFHSLEDRVVKNAFRQMSLECSCPPGSSECQCGQRKLLKILTKKPLVPTEDEIKRNPRARSAKLRVAERI
jgi:16S rRNA (cytosine1402-N4)-methyltransferase